MIDEVVTEFTDALKQNDLEAIRRSPKADLHNHFVLGGSRQYLLKHTGKDIQPIKRPIHSMDEMHGDLVRPGYDFKSVNECNYPGPVNPGKGPDGYTVLLGLVS